jgi:hypothetical protein
VADDPSTSDVDLIPGQVDQNLGDVDLIPGQADQTVAGDDLNPAGGDPNVAGSQPKTDVRRANAVRPAAAPRGRILQKQDKLNKRAPGVANPRSPRR